MNQFTLLHAVINLATPERVLISGLTVTVLLALLNLYRRYQVLFLQTAREEVEELRQQVNTLREKVEACEEGRNLLLRVIVENNLRIPPAQHIDVLMEAQPSEPQPRPKRKPCCPPFLTRPWKHPGRKQENRHDK